MNKLDDGAKGLGEIVDRLITVPIFSGSSLATRPVVIDLYAAARKKNENPLSYTAAEKILSSIDSDSIRNKTIMITTGFVVPPWIEPETDGPVGAVSLARCLSAAFGVTPIFVTEPSSVAKLSHLSNEAGFRVTDYENAKRVSRRVCIEGFTLDSKQARQDSRTLLDKVNPSVVIAVEKASPNKQGVFHSGIGVDVTALSARVDILIDEAKNLRIPTIGIGDAGNEIGMGMIEDTVREILPTGKDCGCPCHYGVASSISTDSLIVCGTSNWGCSAIESILSYHLKAPEILHDGNCEEFLIRAAASSGFIDPASGFADASVDAIPAKVHAELVSILNFITKSRYGDSLYIRNYRAMTRDKAGIADLIAKETGSKK
jgi:D-glutamate cyclase